MGIQMMGNYLFVTPNEKHFCIASNFSNYFEIGDPSKTKYYLEGRIENNEFFINGKLFIPDSNQWCNIKDNLPQGGNCSKETLPNGYRVKNAKGITILEMILDSTGQQCNVNGVIYDEGANVIAEGSKTGFVVHKGPAVIGKSGQAKGIVIG